MTRLWTSLSGGGREREMTQVRGGSEREITNVEEGERERDDAGR
jgi:hypothetical protein